MTFNQNDWTGYDPATQGYAYDLTSVPGYSDLDIQQYSLEMDLAYDINPDLALGVGLAMTVYEDDDPYLFSDDGELYVLSAGLNYVF